MKIVIKKLDPQFNEECIVYVKTDDDVNVEAVIGASIEVPIYIEKYKNKYDIKQVINYEL
ncbi:hypothetical protein CMO86_01825 [Candidatus Woesearchaeota archaeon]|jgi:hypothetical protein|nr:hypothetical protein [Candidatus Woesearchaeota archaeon]|tara:strand:+ start:144 stop:323 length:180 start_codon:yes stop_codon:yes gene_type:complete